MATRSPMNTKSTIKRTTSGDSLGKEKRGTSPSNNPNTATQKGTFTRSTSDAREKLSSSSSAPAPSLEKQTPNYLKSTISLSSRHDHHHHQPSKLNVKKSSTDDQKLLRRRSFDKPPSSSPRVQKALISPPSRPRDRTSAAPLAPKERTITARSSSFSGRSSTSSTAISWRPVLDRSSTSLSSRQSLDGRSSSFAPKTPKAVKPQPVFTSRTMKKTAKTKECNASSLNSSAKTSKEEAEAKQEDEKECQLNNEVGEDTIEVESDEIEVHDDLIPKWEKNEEDDDHDHQMEKVIDEIATISDGHIEEIEDKPHDEEKMEEKQKEIDVVVEVENADDDDHHEETTHESGGDQEKGVEEKITSDDHHHEIIGDENNKVEEKAQDDQDNGDQVGEGSEELVAKQEAENGISAAALTANKWPGGQGKKESPTAYNDVIEETASKLLEKRKNKVKALVGAFETVIDYESGASK
ncbi:hypothetical protein Ddye_004704 [Dipteronia dyeriana]|uniref:Calmodulin-binding domain-containing protein n=1 Tax=Dipteronia dyeriana TaxID=168575 RepID=A0AAD9XET3_9ROSI|nr:hypothetical protein Ddye_004704 [Dipteronia dyeriana]